MTASHTSSATATPTATPSFTPYPWFMAAYMYGNLYDFASTNGFRYHVSPWATLQQYTNAETFVQSLGTFTTWDTVADATCPTGVRLVSMRYSGGSACTGGPGNKVAAYVNVSCGDTTNGFIQSSTAYSQTVTTPATCIYALSLVVDCELNDPYGMCVPPASSSATPSSTATRSHATTSQTRSATASTTAQITVTRTASGTGTSSSSASSSSSPSASDTATGKF